MKDNETFDNYRYIFSYEFDSRTAKKCKCGHVVNFHGKNKNSYCKYCGELLFGNKKAEFDYRIKRRFGK